MAAKNANTVATDEFKNLQVATIKSPNYSTQKLMSQAFQIFLLSYPEWDQTLINDNLYRPKFNEFVQIVAHLFDFKVNKQQLNNAIERFWNVLKDVKMAIVLTAKKVLGRDKASLIALTLVNIDDSKTSAPIELNLKSEAQINKKTEIIYTFNEMRIVKQSQRLRIKMDATEWTADVVNQEAKDLVIAVNQIHAEGYEQWFDFGRGVRVLLEIVWKCKNSSPNVTNTVEKEFHLHVIYQMMAKQVDRHSGLQSEIEWHKKKMKTFVSFERPAIDNNDQRFWRSTTLTKSKEGTSQSEEQSEQKVLYFDLQRGYNFGEDMEERVCLCNQWCNWSAFFHYNPIYRFIIVQNSQLFFEFAGNIPDIYLFDATELLANTANNLKNALVFPLLHSANNYHFRYLHKYFLKIEDFRATYKRSNPNPINMTGCAYNRIRYELPIVKILHQFESDPSGDLCLRGLLKYNRILNNVNHYCSLCPSFVPKAKKTRWNDEYVEALYERLSQFLTETYSKFLTTPTLLPLKDRLFDVDIEYQNYVPKNETENEIKYMRVKALQYRSADDPETTYHNPLNVTFKLEPLANTFIWVYKFFTQIKPMFTEAKAEGWKKADDGCIEMDKDFLDTYMHLTQQQKDNIFELTDEEMTANAVPIELRQHFYALYALKLYSIAYVVQRHCLKAHNMMLTAASKKGVITWIQAPDVFRMITHYIWLEQPFRSVSANNRLFRISSGVINQMIDAFYITYWGRAPHEQNVPKKPDFIHCITSAINQYKKLFVWMKYNGDSTKKFRALMAVLKQQLEHQFVSSQEICVTHLKPIYQFLSQHQHGLYDMETMDAIILNLVRGICFCNLSTIVLFLRRINETFEIRALSSRFLSYLQSKPGWSFLFFTIQLAYNELTKVSNQYIVYDDEMGRIIQTLDDTTQTIKLIYRNLYYKLSRHWMEELYRMNEHATRVPAAAQTQANSLLMANLMQLQLVFGITFTTKMNHMFRYTFFVLRITLNRLFRVMTGQKPHFQRFQACKGPTQTFLQNFFALSQTQDMSNVANSQIWSNFLGQYIPDILTLQPNDVGLDMAQADVL